MSEKKTKIKPLKLKQVVRMDKVELYFDDVKNSLAVADFYAKLTGLKEKIDSAEMPELEKLKKEATVIEKDIEAERAIVNEPLNKIKELNQEIFAPLKNKAANLKNTAKEKYLMLYRAKVAQEAQVQAELDRKRAEEQAKLIAEAEKAREKAPTEEKVFIQPPVIPEVKVAPTSLSKRTIPKSIKVSITDKKEFVRYVVESNNNALWAMIEIGGTKTLQDMAKSNPGNTEIPGIGFDYIPNLEAHLNK
jgi:hypothetical protein